MFCTSCSFFVAPSITVETCGLRRHQATASGAGGTPSSSAIAVNLRARSTRRACGSSSNASRSQAKLSCPSRESCGTPALYLPVSKPEASGDQIVRPRPYSEYSGAYSSSTRSRWNRLYCGCSIVGATRLCARATLCASRIACAGHSDVPQYSTLPWRTSVSIAHTVSAIGTSGSGRWQKYRSR